MSNGESDGNQAIFPPSNCWLGCHFTLRMPQNICRCFSNFTVQTNGLRVLSNSTFCFSRSGVCQRPCISNKLPGDTDAVGWDWPFSNGYKFVMVARMPPSPIFSCPPSRQPPVAASIRSFVLSVILLASLFSLQNGKCSQTATLWDRLQMSVHSFIHWANTYWAHISCQAWCYTCAEM